jgi:hypothetical protein
VKHRTWQLLPAKKKLQFTTLGIHTGPAGGFGTVLNFPEFSIFCKRQTIAVFGFCNSEKKIT